MDFQQSGIVLEKINSLYKSLQAGGGQMAPIERDLMLSYIRQLYDAVLSSSTGVLTATPAPKVEEPPVVAPQRKPAPPKIIEIPDTLKDMTTPPPPVKPTPPPPPPTPKVEERVVRPEPPRQPEPVVQAPPPPPAEPQKPRVTSSKVEALFAVGQARELSDKLGERPVTDLTKAMAINDRLLYVNELFGKDTEAMNETLKVLNKYENFEQARSLLLSIADQYRWADEGTVDTAKAFIKLIRRRYS